MKIVSYVEMTREEAMNRLPYRLIYEFTQSSKWNTGSVKRKFAETFNEEEREVVKSIITKASKYYSKGIPDKGVSITTSEYSLWILFADFLYKLYH